MDTSNMTAADMNALFKVLYLHPFDGNIWKLITLFIHRSKRNNIEIVITDTSLKNHQIFYKIIRPDSATSQGMKNGIVRYQSYEVVKQLREFEKLFTNDEFIMYESTGDRWYHQDENTIVYVNCGIGFIDAMVGNLVS